MHFNFSFTIVQTLWTLTFAALLVLLVVLLGRDRARRFPWFTASIALVALRLLSNRLLYGRMPQFTLSVIFIILADISTVAALLVVVEMARRAFASARRSVWIAGAVALVALGGIVLATWGQWPAWKSLAVDTPIAALALLQLLAQKTSLLVDVLTGAGPAGGALWPPLRRRMAHPHATDSYWPLHRFSEPVSSAGNLADYYPDSRAPLHGRV